MAAHTSTPGSLGGVKFYRPTGGFLVRNKGQENEEKFSAISGVLDRLSLAYDEGNKERKIKAGWCLKISLKDPEDGSIEVVDAKISTTFGRMVGYRAILASKWQSVLINAWPGDDPKITLGTVRPLSEDGSLGKFTVPEGHIPEGSDWENDLIAKVRVHDAYFEAPTDEAEDPYTK